jgi:hypothetical protein
LITTGDARGGYFHELFHKDRPELCRRMRRVAVKIHAPKKDQDKKPVNFYDLLEQDKQDSGESERPSRAKVARSA